MDECSENTADAGCDNYNYNYNDNDSDLARWSQEGGFQFELLERDVPKTSESPDPGLTNAELVQLRIRVIALENLLTALLAQTCEQPSAMAKQMATHISPRPGCTPHRLTLHAAALMQHLGARAHEIRVQHLPSAADRR